MRVDLNADLGETVDGMPTADDEAMFAVISSANIACGGHAGDSTSMTDAVERAARFGVAVGAHPSYDDRANFGRLRRDPAPVDLRDSIAAQLAALAAAGADVLYVKPHGALYHAVIDDVGQARAVIAAVADFSARLGRALPVLGLHGAVATAAKSAGLPFVQEAFLDRGYTALGTLVPRGEPGALVDDPALVAERALRFTRDREVEAVDGARIAVDAASLCLHGDTPSAVAMARAVRAALDTAGVDVRAPW
ncbi:5-oxoprolinase subunit PxpA [Microbacterium sp. VKM Ac-2923]|uniref:5-oxoprolinase subunit PxpA n=1 Tax=Microbacterium sp. VKM Ac-2923 TaxID=2929476 RepID=UPI001FB2A373|nr:5-oxoprolinase subunit PxpA [Microbacterium sp. VKM Ac-2923]MCJ1706313.1 LamB/YcsF family protein [Microbacterium sp. VKM Ac-2923]